MTGFSRVRKNIRSLGVVSLEIRSVNHRFLDIVLHLPEGFAHFEQRIKDEIGKRVRRGRIVCRLDINSHSIKKPVLNKRLIKEYYLSLKKMSQQLKVKQDLGISGLMSLPGVWSLQAEPSLYISWRKLHPLIKAALDKLINKRQQEGRELYKDIGTRLKIVESLVKKIKQRFKKVVSQRLRLYNADAEKNSFLKNSDINEEIVRLSFHLRSFNRCLKSKKAIGKELDFILQEMQRESNTIGAKSIDSFISGRIVRIKSAIERMREQVQNVE